MMMRAVLVLTAFFLAACGGGDEDPGDDTVVETPDPTAVPRIEETGCRFTVPPELGLAHGDDYRCGDLVVYEDRAKTDGALLRLHYIQIDGASREIATIYLDGGPGGDGGSILSALAFGEASVKEALLGAGDFLTISQRGTGLSQPALICDQNDPSTSSCATTLSAVANLAAFNTASNADDIDDLRQALGYDSLNLYGISYGSRLALEVLRRHGDNVRSAIAGGTVPAHVVWPAETPANFQGAVAALNASCQNDEACAAAYGDLSATIVRGIDDLNLEPAIVTAFGQQFPLDGNTYAALVFQLLYSRATYGLLPLVISDLADGRTDRVTDLLVDIFLSQQGAAGRLADGMYMSIVCGEIFNPTPDDSVFEKATEDVPGSIVDSLGANWFNLAQSCAEWPTGKPMPELSELVVSDVPTLLSNGRLDPITPPRFGDAAAAGLTNAAVVAFENSGHGSTLQSPCGAQVLSDFLANPGQALDTDCANDIGISFQMPSSAAPPSAIQRERIVRELRTAPIPPWVRKKLSDWGPR